MDGRDGPSDNDGEVKQIGKPAMSEDTSSDAQFTHMSRGRQSVIKACSLLLT